MFFSVPFALLIAAVMGLTAFVSLIYGRSAVDELAVELNERISTGIAEHVRSFAQTPFLFLRVVAAPYVAREQELALKRLDINRALRTASQLREFETLRAPYLIY